MSTAHEGSLVDLIAGLRSPLSGQVRADDIDIARLDLESYRNQIAVVRLGEVFAGTVAENLRMGRSDLTDHALRNIAEITLGNLKEFAETGGCTNAVTA